MQSQIVTTQSGRKSRISKPIAKAIHLICTEGLTTAEAADIAGVKHHTLYSALRKPHVKAFKRKVLEAHTKHLGQKALKTLADIMADSNASAGVRRQCAMDLMEIAGFYQKDEVSQDVTTQKRDSPQSFTIHIHSPESTARPDHNGIVDVHHAVVEDALAIESE